MNELLIYPFRYLLLFWIILSHQTSWDPILCCLVLCSTAAAKWLLLYSAGSRAALVPLIKPYRTPVVPVGSLGFYAMFCHHPCKGVREYIQITESFPPFQALSILVPPITWFCLVLLSSTGFSTGTACCLTALAQHSCHSSTDCQHWHSIVSGCLKSFWLSQSFCHWLTQTSMLVHEQLRRVEISWFCRALYK